MANDDSIPLKYRTEMKTWGLCQDEFQDNLLAPHWPPSLYVRAARRLIGDTIFTQNTPHEQQIKQDGIGNLSIGIGGYNFDSHNSERWAIKNSSSCSGNTPKNHTSGTFYAWNEGDVEIAPGLYQLPYWIMFPKRKEVSNLLVVAAPSSSHIGMSTLRMEPQFMTIGHAAGIIASIFIESGKSVAAVQEIDTGVLHARLMNEGAILNTNQVKKKSKKNDKTKMKRKRTTDGNTPAKKKKKITANATGTS